MMNRMLGRLAHRHCMGRLAYARSTQIVARLGSCVAVPVGGPVDAITVMAGALAGRSNPVRLRTDDAPPFHLYWGDLHGMMFNHRPLADYFWWARDVARLDWAGGQLFSYLASVAPVWQ